MIKSYKLKCEELDELKQKYDRMKNLKSQYKGLQYKCEELEKENLNLKSKLYSSEQMNSIKT